MKATKTQLDILQKMNDGWELGYYQGLVASCNLKEGGIGRGGQSQQVKTNTFFALWMKGLIVISKYGPSTDKYSLTEKGKALLGG